METNEWMRFHIKSCDVPIDLLAYHLVFFDFFEERGMHCIIDRAFKVRPLPLPLPLPLEA